MQVINFAEFATLEQMKDALEGIAERQEVAMLIVNGKVLMLSAPEFAKDQIAMKIATRFAENPMILHDLQTRLESETSEKW
jgi:hypothetical protein